MTEVFLEFSGANAKAQREGILTSGMVGVPVHLAFDSAWDGLSVTLVFEGSGVTKDVVLNGETECVLPWEVLVQSGTKVKAGAEGRDVNGELVLPSVMTVIGKTFLGADPEGDESTDPTLPVWAQIQSTIGDLSKLETTKKDTLVNAINSANRSGGNGGGGAGVLIVADDGGIASHTSQQIYNHVQAGGTAYFDNGGMLYILTSVDENTARFQQISSEDGAGVEIVVYGDYSLEYFDAQFVNNLYHHQIRFGDPDDYIIYTAEDHECSPHFYLEVYNRNPDPMNAVDLYNGGHFPFAKYPPFWLSNWDDVDDTYAVCDVSAYDVSANDVRLFLNLWNPAAAVTTLRVSFPLSTLYVNDEVTGV